MLKKIICFFNERFEVLIILLVTALTTLSFYIRFYYLDFMRMIGIIPGDIWYFYVTYKEAMKNLFYYPIEYPVGYIIIQKIIMFINQFIFKQLTYQSFLLSHAIIMIPTTIITVLLIYKLAGNLGVNKKLTFLYLVTSPTLFIASNQNYDIFPIFFTILAIFTLFKNRLNYSMFFLAVATIIKLYPAFLLLLFLLFAISKKTTSSKIIKSIGIFIATVVLINLPFMISNFNYWIYAFVKQTNNPQSHDPNTISYFLNYLGLGSYRILFFALIMLISWIVVFIFHKKRLLTPKNFILLAYFICFSAVYSNHVNTPQYLLWFLPFAAILQLPALYFWWFFDLINSLILYFNYYLVHYTREQLLNLFLFGVVNFTFFYIFLFRQIIFALKQNEKS